MKIVSTRARVTCRCGLEVSRGSWIRHLRGKRKPCAAKVDWKMRAIGVLTVSSKHRIAWKKSDGLEGVGTEGWFVDVVLEKCNLEDWIFEAPRPHGKKTESALLKSSSMRKLTENPASKKKMEVIDKKEVIKRAYELKAILDADVNFTYFKMYKILTKEFPGWSGFFYESTPISSKDREPRFRGDNYQNSALAVLFNISIESICKEAARRRGLKISRGQRASEYCIMKARESGSKSLSSHRTTLPQRRLHALVRRYDAKARLEYTVGHPHFKSFDVYSPKYNILFEMHGRVWHDLRPKTNISKDLIRKNIQNDLLKADIALELKMPLYIFWDDEENQWENALEIIFLKKSTIKSYSAK